MYSFNGQPPYPVPENIISGDLSVVFIQRRRTKLLFVSDATGKGDVYTLSLKDWKTKEQINSEHSEMAPRFDANGNIVYTRKAK